MEELAADLADAVAYAEAHAGETPRSGATYGGGTPPEQVAGAMSSWLDATQALPPT
jgi:hypothetical protein